MKNKSKALVFGILTIISLIITVEGLLMFLYPFFELDGIFTKHGSGTFIDQCGDICFVFGLPITMTFFTATNRYSGEKDVTRTNTSYVNKDSNNNGFTPQQMKIIAQEMDKYNQSAQHQYYENLRNKNKR